MSVVAKSVLVCGENGRRIITVLFFMKPTKKEYCCDIGICERQRLNISTHCDVSGGIIYFECIDRQSSKHGGPCKMCERIISS